MRRILILTSLFLPEPGANGMIVNNISKVLLDRGYEVTCLSMKEKSLPAYDYIDGIEIYRITPSLYSRMMECLNTNNKLKSTLSKLLQIFRKIKLAVLLPNFPSFDIIQNRKTYKAIKKITNLKNYDMVLGVFKPYSNIAALLKFKRNYPETLCGAYYLDLITSMQKPNLMPKRLYDWLCIRTDYKVYSKLDFSLVAKAGKRLHEDTIFDSIRTKIDYIDFPTFCIMNEDEYDIYVNDEKSDSTIKLIYAGTLDRNFRNPEYLLKALSDITTKFGIKINFHFYGKGNCSEILEFYNDSQNLSVFNHGLVDSSIVRKEMLKSDFLVNISNEINLAVPSKIFELFSIGKPIINIVSNDKDITNTYFKKYPSVFFLKNKMPIDTQINELHQYILEERGKNYSINEIVKNYVENTPDYTVDLLESKFNI